MSHFIYCYAEYRYAECRYAECRYAECRGVFILALNFSLIPTLYTSVIPFIPFLSFLSPSPFEKTNPHDTPKA